MNKEVFWLLVHLMHEYDEAILNDKYLQHVRDLNMRHSWMLEIDSDHDLKFSPTIPFDLKWRMFNSYIK